MKIAGRQYYIFRLDEDVKISTKRIKHKESWQSDKFHIFIENETTNITVKNGYEWDGCTPKFHLFDIVFGIPDGVPNPKTNKPKAYFASCVHDILYEHAHILPSQITRKIADQIFYDELKKANFAPAKIYYFGVRVFGWLWWRKSLSKKT